MGGPPDDQIRGWTILPRWEGPYPDPDFCEAGYEPEAGVAARGDGGLCRCGRRTPWRERSSGRPVCSPGCREEADRLASLPSWPLPAVDSGPFPWE